VVAMPRQHFFIIIDKFMINKSTFLLLLGLVILFGSCKDSITDNPLGNKAPTTKVFLNPDSTVSKQQSTLDIHWTGDDPDGLVIGYFFSWDGTNWSFTTKNDSTFLLKIGAKDSSYVFRVAAADDKGNGVYDTDIYQNGIHYGPEPFVDANGNGKYDKGEFFYDIGLIDPHPATLTMPITNTAPVIGWQTLSTLPDYSFPVMSFGWNVTDLDGEATVDSIRIALNDTNQYISIGGSVRNITLRATDFSTNSPKMDILVDGSSSSVLSVKLPGLKLNDYNVLYVQAVDIAGATSKWINTTTQSPSTQWYVKKPSGKIVIIDDYAVTSDNTTAANFYNAIMDSLGMTGKYDVYDIKTQVPPYINATFFETLKLFKAVLWYSDYNTPSLDLAQATVQKYLLAGGKMAFSMQFPITVDANQVAGFLPVISDSTAYKTYIFKNVKVSASKNDSSYPDLTSSSTVNRVRAFYLQSVGTKPLYYFPNNELPGSMGFKSSDNSLFFIGLPLHLMNATPGSVTALLNKVFFTDFNLTK
jgi:hypothetical protein